MAALEGDGDKLQTAISGNATNKIICGRALREAAAKGHKNIIHMLLDIGTPIDACGGLYGTVLQSASASGHLGIVELLLQRGADITVEGGVFGNALRAAVANGHIAIVTHFLGQHCGGMKKAHLNASLITAITTRQDSIVKQLLDAGADVNTPDNVFGDPWHLALLTEQPDMATMLLRRGAIRNQMTGLLRNRNPFQRALAIQEASASAAVPNEGDETTHTPRPQLNTDIVKDQEIDQAPTAIDISLRETTSSPQHQARLPSSNETDLPPSGVPAEPSSPRSESPWILIDPADPDMQGWS